MELAALFAYLESVTIIFVRHIVPKAKYHVGMVVLTPGLHVIPNVLMVRLTAKALALMLLRTVGILLVPRDRICAVDIRV